MRAGRLNQVIELQRSSQSEDAYGQEIESWETFASVWAGIEPSKSTEQFTEDQLNSRIDALIVMRYRDDIDMSCRVSHTDRSNNTHIYQLIGEVPSPAGHGYQEIKFNAMLLHREARVEVSE